MSCNCFGHRSWLGWTLAGDRSHSGVHIGHGMNSKLSREFLSRRYFHWIRLRDHRRLEARSRFMEHCKTSSLEVRGRGQRNGASCVSGGAMYGNILWDIL
ncbi:hypothetical protein DL95DRAFT_382209, partial [Leptodontidium sp. 2 PMI_412]